MSTPAACPPGPGRIPAGTLVFVFVLVAFWVIQGTLVYQKARHHDYLSFYTGATLMRSGQGAALHDLDAQREMQRELAPGNEEIIPFIRPSYYAVMLAPLSLLPFGAGFWFWILLQTVLLVACWIWAGRHFGWDAMIFGAIYFPTAAGVSNAQDCVFLLGIAILAYRLADRERDFWSGVVLGLGLIKFNLFLLLPIVILVRKRWNMFAGYCATGIMALTIALLVEGLEGVGKYAALLRRDDLTWLSPAPELMINLRAIGANFGMDSAGLRAALIVLVTAVTIWGARQAPLWRWLSVALIGSVLVTPHAYAYDAAILLLPIWLVLFRSQDRVARIAAATLAVPLPFLPLLIGPPWTVIPSLTVLAFLVALAWDNHRARQTQTLAHERIAEVGV